MDETGLILGEYLVSQKAVHLRTGGIIPTTAQRLHKENIAHVVQKAMERGGVTPNQLSAVATTVMPGLALSLGIGLQFSQKFVRHHSKLFIPIHHMEAHALTIRMIQPVNFPYLVLLISGGHSLLALARGINDFLLLGQTLDEAPGDTLDKVARRLSIIKHPKCSKMSGGEAIELLAQEGNRLRFLFKTPMGQHCDCNFSFAGLRNQVTMAIQKKEKEEGAEKGTLLSCVSDIAAATQHSVASHIAKRTHRAILFCKAKGFLPSINPTLVVSGGVASNQYIRKTLKIVTQATQLNLLCPPAKYCTDNGVMIAWAPLGVDITAEVKNARIKVPSLKLRIED
ncbi:tRNA N6-adenosine threonylcarbamoyltransferase, mitochondrial isoform 2-T2 [Aplochiton taeniatus]